MFIFMFFIKKPWNVGTNSNIYMFKGEYVKDIRESFVCSSNSPFAERIFEVFYLRKSCQEKQTTSTYKVRGMSNVFHAKRLFDKLEGNRELLFCSILNVKEMQVIPRYPGS